MKHRLLLFIKLYVFWILFFVVQKPFFMLWQYGLLGDVHWTDWFLVPWHGLPLDLSVASYVMLAVGLILCVSFWVRWHIIRCIFDGLTALCLTVGLWTVLGDNGCFPSWGYHLNQDIFEYLATPREALACAPWWVWTLGCVGFAVLFAIWWWIYKKLSIVHCQPPTKKVLSTLGMLLITGALFLPIRGSVTVSTMNSGRVYFSDNQMLNVAAVNPLFNIMESLGSDVFDVAKYTYMPSDKAKQCVEDLLSPARFNSDTTTLPLLTTPRPNIIFFILESFSQNAWGAMPNVQRISWEGVYFSNIYASSYRTDRGVVATLSAFPGQPTSSLMVVPYKSQSLPQLGQCLKQAGYKLKFFYGGDEDFTNMRSYLVQGGFENRVADRDFAPADRLSKWGVPDHIVFDRALSEIVGRKQDTAKHLDVILSLSSHEPFEVDYHHLENPYLNAIAYTDSCLGAFMDTLRNSPIWDSTLVVMVADHGFPYPDGLANYMPARYRIPVVMAGGAVQQARQIDRLGSQVDLVPTLLCQMGLEADGFLFGKNMVDTTQQEFAFFAFNDGFGLIRPNDTIVVDAKADKVLIGTNPQTEHYARALIQRVMETIQEL
ncbi:MAG: sulfatase-like hydrolase/transferase [Paludibacteraceae bacterium]|nr:sulfatase-like hydrolase/transferase [Paludibacteraceae bacterium]